MPRFRPAGGQPAKPAIRRTLLDRAVGIVSPAAELNRIRARAAVDMAAYWGGGGMGGYEGASRTKRSLASWFTRALSADQALLPSLPELRNRSRDLERNSPIAGGAISTVVDNVVGAGLVPLPTVDAAFLKGAVGMTETEAEQWEADAARLWRHVSESEDVDVERSANHLQQQELVLREVLTAGDVFPIRRYIERPSRLLGFTVQLVEGERCCNPNGEPATHRLAAGVEYDADSAAIAYHFRTGTIGDPAAPQRWVRVPARDDATGLWTCRRLFAPKRPGQRRGVPYLAPVIETIKQLDRYSEAEIMAAVMNSCFAIVMKSPTGEGSAGLDPLSGGEDASVTDRGEIVLTEAGTIVDLGENEEIQGFNAARPNSNFDPFYSAMVKQIGVGLGIPFEVLMKSFNSSYTASKGALEVAWQMFRSRRAWLVRGFCHPCYEAAITEAVASGLLIAPGYFDHPLIRAAYLGAQWIGPSQPILDEVKAATAAEKRINIEISTRSSEAAARGGDYRQIHQQRAREEKARREAGLAMADASAPAAAALPAVPDDEDEEGRGNQ
ncbi:phage portal protein [Oceanibaculum indicum]|uniref:Portal protein n=1 Tax=Oceanibaculum indicum P24 TaxID=1207063 RepID=K2IL77_9PROT|nr:phage portal protein [Oceanibaculum indicum]EKE70886.1 portal protein [Oceanibaculum indicum P24]